MLPRRALAASIAIAFHAVALVAQTPGNGLELRAASSDSSHIDGGSVFTSVFTVKNLGADTARVQPTLIVPRGWTIVMGNSPFAIAPGKTETWLVGVSVPGSAPAARYLLRGALGGDGTTGSDSIVVQVNEHRAIEIVSLEMPGWVVAGSHDHRAAHFGREPRHRSGNAVASLDRRGFGRIADRARGRRDARGQQD